MFSEKVRNLSADVLGKDATVKILKKIFQDLGRNRTSIINPGTSPDSIYYIELKIGYKNFSVLIPYEGKTIGELENIVNWYMG